jgi:hypothetical protein
MIVVCLLTTGAAALQASPEPAQSPQEIYPLVFPVGGPHSFTDTFGAPRDGQRLHQGIDIFADKLTPVVAAADGTVRRIGVGERAGRYIVIEHQDGWLSYYLHLNNDSPGTDDGLVDDAVPGITIGAAVAAGDLLDYVGDSGNAESTPSHLHFELHRPSGDIVNPYPHLLAASGAPQGQVDVALSHNTAYLPATRATAVVGTFDPGDGFAAGVWVHDGMAYLGTWGRPQACPASGVRIIDVVDPAVPELVGALATGAEFPETDTDSVWVGAVATEAFAGDIAVIAVSLCDNRERNRGRVGFRGLAIYDVTNPTAPLLLSTLPSGDRTQGVHEIDVVTRDDGRVLVAATVMQSLIHTEGLQGDVRLVDITDPRKPIELADWDLRRDGSPAYLDTIEADGEEQLHAHSVAFASGGKRLWVAHWDAGAVLLDVADPANPSLAAGTPVLASAEGNVHSVVSDAAAGLVVLSSEDLYPRDTRGHRSGWGYQAVLDLGGGELGRVTVGGAAGDEDERVPLDGFHTAHNAQLIERRLYSSWYSSGVRITDLSIPAEPVEIGYFVPPPTADPQGYWIAPDGSTRMPLVWDVRVVGDLIYVSDMNSGLWIVRYTGDDVLGFEPG